MRLLQEHDSFGFKNGYKKRSKKGINYRINQRDII